MKRELLKPENVDRAAFHNQRSYEAALYAVAVCNNIIRRANAGDVVFEYENMVRPDFKMTFDKDGLFTGLYLVDGENSWVWIVGDVSDHDTGLFYVTKYAIREYFKLWRVAKVVNVSKVTDLTK